jgi:hypothetical protein
MTDEKAARYADDANVPPEREHDTHESETLLPAPPSEGAMVMMDDDDDPTGEVISVRGNLNDRLPTIVVDPAHVTDIMDDMITWLGGSRWRRAGPGYPYQLVGRASKPHGPPPQTEPND